MSHSRNVMVKQESSLNFVCYVCGSISGDFIPLHSKPRENGPYFSFLEHHQPPNGSARPGPDGVVGSCFICYSFLSQQWESFERNGTSHSKRLYWLKRTDNVPFAGMDVGNQSEYATSYLGFVPPTNHTSQLDKRDSISPADSVSQSTLGSQYNKQDYPEPLDCTIEDNSRLSQKQNVEVGENSSVLDLSVQTRPSNAVPILSVSPNSSSLVCYTCGEDVFRGALFSVFTKPVANYPYFPSLWSHPKNSRAKAMDTVGKIEVCELCHRQLIRQWEVYERANVPNNERQYQFQGNYNQVSKESNTSSNTPNTNNQFFCFTCGQEYPKSVRRELKTRPSSDGEPYFRFLEKHHPAPGARPITNDWRVMVCTLCYKALFRQFRVYQIEKTPEELRTYKIPAEFLQESNVLRDRLLGHSKNERQVIDVSAPSSCYLCDRSSNNIKMVNTLPNQASKMYFPFIREITKTSTSDPMDSLGRVAICLTCYLLLQTQWEAFQNAQVPINQRHYSLNHSANHFRASQLSPSPPSLVQESAKNHNSTLHIQVTTPEEQSSVNHHNVAHEPLLTTVTTMSYSSVITTPSRHIPIHPPPALLPHKEHSELVNRSSKSSKESAIDENQENANNPRIYNPLELPKTKQPLMIATTCFICGECSSPGSTYTISVFPSRSGVSEDFQTPFFPFLSKHVKPTASDTITEDGTILGCTFCYHSLMAQWLAYETSPHAEDANHWTRKYNTHHYVCYICGITTYRKRVRAITVRDFPFLVEHPRPPGALTTQNGESVVTCLTCFESLMSQWKDFERMKLPVEMRKYNWIPIPPPPDDINLIDPATRQQNLSRDSTPGPSVTSRTPTPLGPSSSGHLTTQDASSSSGRHENQIGLGHGVAKPAPTMLNMQQQQQHPNCNTNNKPVSVRGMATAVSPLYQVGPPPSHAPPPPPSSHGGNHNLGVYGGSPAAAYNAARTSSFAAALRKLAKQAVDPATEKDLSPITPVSSPAYSQRSATPKRSIQGVYINNVHSHSHQNRLPSPPPSSNSSLVNHDSQKRPLDLGSVSSRDSNGNRLGEPLPLKLDNKYDKREDHYSIKDLSSSVLNSRSQISSRLEDHQVPSPILPTTTSSSGRGFQPYRGLEDGNRHSLGSHSQGPSHHHPNAPPSSHHMAPHFEHSAGYAAAYHSAFLPPPHLAHPAYRFEDPVFLEHYSSMLRPPSLIHPLSQAGLLPHGPPPPPVPQPSTGPPPSVPFFPSTTPNSHYPRDLMISQAQSSVSFVSPSSVTAANNHDSRLKFDERMTNREPYSSSEQDSYDRRELQSSGINRRLSDPVNESGNEQRSSPMQPLHLTRHIESPGGDHRIGSITHGTPREHHHSSGLGPPQSRSPESPSGSASTPLNLAIHHNSTNNPGQDTHRSRHHDVELWVARHVGNAANNVPTSQNHHVPDRLERYSPVTPSQPPPLLSAPPPSTLSGSQQPVPLEQHQVPIRSEYQHSLPANYHLQANVSSQREAQEINRQYQIHQQQYMRQQQLQHRKHSSSVPAYNSSSDANRTNQYDKSKNKFNSSKMPDNSHISNNILSQNHGYNGASHRTDDMFIKTHDRERENLGDSRSTEKAVTLDRWTYYRQEGMQSRLMELEKPAMECKEPPSVPAHHYNYSQHQSNEHARGFQIVSRSNHVESNCVEVLVSKLDLEEARLKKARMDGDYLSESESSDIEDNSNRKEYVGPKPLAKKDVLNQKELWQDWGPRSLSRPFILSKGPSTTLDCSPSKMEILRSVGLMTVKRRKELELDKFFKRQQHLKEALPLKLVEKEDQENRMPFPISIVVSSLSTRQAIVSNTLSKKLNSENGKSKWQQKNFLASLDLKVNQDDDREEHEVIWRAIVQDRCRRHKITLPLMENQDLNCILETYECATNETEPRGVKRKHGQSLLPHHNGLVSNKNNALSLHQSGALVSNDTNPSTDSSKENDKLSLLPLTNHVPEFHNPKFSNPRSGVPPLQSIISGSGQDQSGPPSIPPPLIPTGRSSKPMTIATLDSEKRVVLLTNSTSKIGSVSSTLAPSALSKDKLSSSGMKPPPLSTSSARQMPREFAQEFHQLVLQTTKQQLENNMSRDSVNLPVPPPLLNPNSASSSITQNQTSHAKTQLNIGASYSGMPKLANSILSSSSSSHHTASVSSFFDNFNAVKHESGIVQETFRDRDSDGCLKWPGIEAIMESFEKHRREQNLEREFLSERCQYNQSHTQELDRAAEIYSQRMAELYQLKCHLDEERQRHQSAIDNLKKCLRQIR